MIRGIFYIHSIHYASVSETTSFTLINSDRLKRRDKMFYLPHGLTLEAHRSSMSIGDLGEKFLSIVAPIQWHIARIGRFARIYRS